ncbi:MAG: hypothetical protein Q4G44_02965 [Alcaligenaceae bacterium]|nr:hypothetical protein [Alcaligenaceae bacterium]
MAKSKLKNPLIIILLLAVIAAAVWFFVNKTISRKAEQQFEQFLVQNNLQDKLTWTKLEADPTGKAKLKEVKILDENKNLIFTAEEFNLTHYKESADLLEIGFDFKHLVDAKGDVFQNHIDDYFADLDMATPQSLDLAWHMKLDGPAQKSTFKPSIVVPDFMQIDGELNTDSPTTYIQMATVLSESASASADEARIDFFSLMALANNIKLQDLTLVLENKGGMQPLIESLKKKELPGDSTAALEQQREELWQSKLEESKQDCLTDDELALVVADNNKACNSLFDFMNAKSDSVKIKIAVAKPISIEEMMMGVLMGANTERFLKEYEPTVVIE